MDLHLFCFFDFFFLLSSLLLTGGEHWDAAVTSLGVWAAGGVGLLYLTTLSGCGEDDTSAASSVEDEIRLVGPTSEGIGFRGSAVPDLGAL